MAYLDGPGRSAEPGAREERIRRDLAGALTVLPYDGPSVAFLPSFVSDLTAYILAHREADSAG